MIKYRGTKRSHISRGVSGGALDSESCSCACLSGLFSGNRAVRLGAMDTGEQGMAVTFVVGRVLGCTQAVYG